MTHLRSWQQDGDPVQVSCSSANAGSTSSLGQAAVMGRAGRSLPVKETSDMRGCPGFSRHTGDVWWERKEKRGEGAALKVGNTS